MFFIDINSMPHYTVILHALHNLSFSFTITFTFNNHKTIVDIHYNYDNNIFLTSSLIIHNIYIHSLRSGKVVSESISLPSCMVHLRNYSPELGLAMQFHTELPSEYM